MAEISIVLPNRLIRDRRAFLALMAEVGRASHDNLSKKRDLNPDLSKKSTYCISYIDCKVE